MRQKAAVGLFAAVVALLGCKKSDPPPSPSVPPAQPSQLQAATAAPSAQLKPRRAELPELAARLGKIMAKPADHATNKDVGDKLVTFTLKPFAGIDHAVFVGNRKEKKAWRFGLEYLRCDELDQLGLQVTELERREGALFSAWYEVDGGPLSGCWVKVHAKSVTEPDLCSVLPGTPPYWELQGDVPKSRAK